MFSVVRLHLWTVCCPGLPLRSFDTPPRSPTLSLASFPRRPLSPSAPLWPRPRPSPRLLPACGPRETPWFAFLVPALVPVRPYALAGLASLLPCPPPLFRHSKSFPAPASGLPLRSVLPSSLPFLQRGPRLAFLLDFCAFTCRECTQRAARSTRARLVVPGRAYASFDLGSFALPAASLTHRFVVYPPTAGSRSKCWQFCLELRSPGWRFDPLGSLAARGRLPFIRGSLLLYSPGVAPPGLVSRALPQICSPGSWGHVCSRRPSSGALPFALTFMLSVPLAVFVRLVAAAVP